MFRIERLDLYTKVKKTSFRIFVHLMIPKIHIRIAE